MIGMREILRHFANISRSDIVGMRAPFLKPGRNTQYEVIGFTCTIHLSNLCNFIVKLFYVIVNYLLRLLKTLASFMIVL